MQQLQKRKRTAKSLFSLVKDFGLCRTFEKRINYKVVPENYLEFGIEMRGQWKCCVNEYFKGTPLNLHISCKALCPELLIPQNNGIILLSAFSRHQMLNDGASYCAVLISKAKKMNTKYHDGLFIYDYIFINNFLLKYFFI